MLLEGDAMRRVYDDFRRVEEAEGRGLTAEEFIGAMVRHAGARFHDPRELIKMLVDLFQYVARLATYR